MLKLLPIVLIVGIILGGGIFFLLQKSANSKNSTSLFANLSTQSSSSRIDKVAVLEAKVEALSNQISGGINVAQATNSSSIETRIKTLETTIVDLQKQLAIVKANSTTKPVVVTQTSTTNPKYPLYIPLGSSGSLGDRNYLAVDGYEVSIDPADYPGYKTMNLEVSLRLIESVGVVNARVFNFSDNSGISASVVSTNSSTFKLLSSSGFTLPSGRKTYRLQVQSTEGYTVQVNEARIKVNF